MDLMFKKVEDRSVAKTYNPVYFLFLVINISVKLKRNRVVGHLLEIWLFF